MNRLFLAALAALSVASSGCWERVPAGPGILRLAVDGSPGSLLSVTTRSPEIYLAGGFVGVDHALITDGTVGRIVQYQHGRFDTVCRSDEVLWWVTAANDLSGAIFAVGEGGRIIRYQGGRCDTIAFDLSYPEGAPTFFGAYASSDHDLWLVGGSALPTGPRGVLVHWDGTTFTQATLPDAALHENLFKIDEHLGALVVVGTHGTIVEQDSGSSDWHTMPTTIRSEDNTLFTVSCSVDCYAVGGTGTGIFMERASVDGGFGWRSVESIGGVRFADAPGLNGVYVSNGSGIFMVGVAGTTIHTDTSVAYQAPPTTGATLHGVGGYADVIIGVGGELSVTDASQRGVILVRGDASAHFTFDGQSFEASGGLRTSLGGAGQGGR